MNVNALLTDDMPQRSPHHIQQHPIHSTPLSNGATMTPKSLSPNTGTKAVFFRLRDSQNDAKMFQIRAHDTTDSIMDTIKHMLGLSRQYDLGISLEDEDGMSFVPSYDNFVDGTTVYVRIEESIGHNYVQRHSYNLRQSAAMGAGSAASSRSYGYPNSRSVSPNSRGRRSASASGRQRGMKRSSLHMNPEDDRYSDDYGHDPQGQWYGLPPQQFLPDDYEGSRTKAGSVASADISVENILEGSRRKRAKFSSDELPLFPPPALPRQNGSISSLSPTRHIPQVATPYTSRHFSFSHPTPPSNAGDYGYMRSQNTHIPHMNGIVPTPAPTVTSCLSDEDVAILLMRLGNANSGSNSASTMEERREGYISEYGEEDEGRSDTTELPDQPYQHDGYPRYQLPDSPILFPNQYQPKPKHKHLDEILPSFDSTIPSDDDENQPPAESYSSAKSQHPKRSSNDAAWRKKANNHVARAGRYEDGTDDSYTPPAQPDEHDADYDDDDELDDIPLKMRREKKLAYVSHATPNNHTHTKPASKPKSHKSVKRTSSSSNTQFKTIPSTTTTDGNYPISPASPPISRKPSVASASSTHHHHHNHGHKSRPSNSSTHSNQSPHPYHPQNGFTTPSSQAGDCSSMAPPPVLAPSHADDGLPQRPRCQRCRKSKKGCDRQRPCQRCKDAGLPEDMCISEDEAGTRRGRQAAAAAKRAAGAVGGDGKVKSKKKKASVSSAVQHQQQTAGQAVKAAVGAV